MKAHPAADLVPTLSDAEYAELREDVRAHGLRVPIVRCQGLILDGRHRYRACEETRTEARFEDYKGDPIAFVLSANLQRRHLTPSQRAAVAAEAEVMYAKTAKGRRAQAKGQPRGAKSVTPNREEETGEATALAAKAAGASRTSTAKAKAVKQADPQRFEDVKAGKESVDAAYQSVKTEQSWHEAVDAYPFLAKLPQRYHKEALASVRQLAAMDPAERNSRKRSFAKWAAAYSRADALAEDEQDERARAAGRVADKVWQAVLHFPGMVERLETHWSDYDGDPAIWAGVLSSHDRACKQLYKLIGSSRMRRVK